MSNDDSLDAFLTADMPAEEKKNNKDTSLEDEFAKLLNDFINQDKPAAKPDNKKTEDSLDSFLESSGSGLDSFLTSPVVPSENTPAAQPQQTSFNAESVENAAQPTEQNTSFLNLFPYDHSCIRTISPVLAKKSPNICWHAGIL